MTVHTGRELTVGGARVYLDGKPQRHSINGNLHFLGATGELAYLAGGTDTFLVRGGKEIGAFEHAKLLTVSKNGREIAFAAKKNGKYWCLADDLAFGPYDDVAHIALSDDGSHVAVATVQDGKAVVLHDDNPGGGKHDQTLALAISPNGENVAYWAKLKDHVLLVKNERSGKGFDGVLPGSSIVWTSNESFVAHAYVGGTIWRLDGRTDGQMPNTLQPFRQQQQQQQQQQQGARPKVRR
jgi:hypothetical protein